ncbi:MAG: methyltransferase domain-containing protein [Deltaproteobacteria bacterium]|nr:methyltransferase domain-containing protein [Deltaproteobacteria bacterium]
MLDTPAMSVATVIIPLVQKVAVADLAGLVRAALAQGQVKELIVAGRIAETDRGALAQLGARTLSVVGGRGTAFKAALREAKGEVVIVQDPDPAYRPSDYPALLAPLLDRHADAVFGVRFGRLEPGGARSVGHFYGRLADAALSALTGALTDLSLSDAETGLKAVRAEILRGMPLSSSNGGIDAEIAVKLAAQLFRIHEVPIGFAATPSSERLGHRVQRALTLMRYSTAVNDADNRHEGYNTLLRMEEGAPRYNAWLGRKLSQHLGKRVLEVGAGIGTITKHIAPGRDLVVALEMDRFYHDRLKNLFAHSPQVVPQLSGVEQVDWQSLRQHRFDSVLLSNVLEHIADDREAVLNFKSVLEPGGRLVILVPANPVLFGSMDEAVGHYRRYTGRALTGLLEGCGFTLEALEPMNVLGIPGWFVNGRILRRRAIPPLQLRAYDLLAPTLAGLEDRLKPRYGMSLLAVARV